MIILGIHGDYFNPSHEVFESNASIVRDGEIISAISEERLSRVKLDGRFPSNSIKENLRITGLTLSDIDYVVFSTRRPIDNAYSYFKSMIRTFFDTSVIVRNEKKMKSHGGSLFNTTFKKDQYKFQLGEQKDNLFNIQFIDHHYAHAAGAYYGSPFDDALVITLDGGGNGLDGGAYTAKGKTLKRFLEIPHFQSPGTMYSAITHDLGFKRHRHEGKITGLAAYGNADTERLGLQHLIRYDRNKHRFISKSIAAHHKNLETKSTYFHPLLEQFSREDVAATVQHIFEEVILDFIDDAANIAATKGAKSRNICLAGGCFANVKLNQKILEMEWFDNIFIFPAMGDGGLSAGAALYHFHQNTGADKKISEVKHVYLGGAFSNLEIESSLKEKGLSYTEYEHVEEEVGRLLAEGKVIARFNGAMEYGPRALGNRSILAAPFDPAINDWLNEKLHRTEFMPFAPVITEDTAAAYFKGYQPSDRASEFMTITYVVKEGLKEKIPAVVHIDNTARPQVVKKEVNESFYEIIKSFERHTGIPVILNTSFNIHEEPIIYTPQEAIKGFLGAKLDYLAIGPFLVPLPK